jgi:alanyl aminopeptidase
MRILSACLLTLFLAVPVLAADPAPPTFRLGDAATPRGYELQLAIDPRQATFSGEVRITFRVNRRTPILWLNSTGLDIERTEVSQGDRRLTTRLIKGGEDFVGIEAEGQPFLPGNALAVIRYRGPIEPNATHGIFRQQEGGEWYVVTQFEAMDARRAFPGFDEPGWKVPMQLTIDSPAADEVVGNTPETLSFDVPDRPGWRRHVFATTKPLPTYLLAFAVGPFDVVSGGVAGANNTPLRYFAPKGRGAEARFAKESTPRLLEILEAYFGIPYPFEKLDTVTIPATVGFGAMENVGMITYSSVLLLARPFEETLTFKRRYAFVGAHEIAHMWFGNLVTLAWWDDTWLNEGFAMWIERKALATYNAEWDAGWRRGEGRRRALAADRLASARRVHNPITDKNDVAAAFDSITYEKGAEVLSMFEAGLGPDRFRQGVRDYLKEHAYGSATSTDFFKAIGKAAGRPESVKAFEAFVDQPGAPLVDVALRCEGGKASIEVSQRRLAAKVSKAPELRWNTPACFRYRADGEVRTQCEDIANGRRVIPLEEAKSCPDWIVGNAGGRGHWVSRYDKPLARRIAERLDDIPVSEATAFAADTALLAGVGLMPMEDALDLADGFLRHPAPAVKHGGVFVLEKLRDDMLTPSQRESKREIVAKRIQPLARELGWIERANDSDDVKELRMMLLPYAARSPGGEGLRPRARELAMRWIADRESVSALMAPAILDTAARFADDATYARLEDASLGMRRTNERVMLLKALVKVREPSLRDRALGLTLRKARGDDVINGRDTNSAFYEVLEDDANRSAAFAYLRANWDALEAKLPFESPSRLITPLGSLCTPEDRATFAEFFKERAARLFGGPKRYEQALESIDICNALRHG